MWHGTVTPRRLPILLILALCAASCATFPTQLPGTAQPAAARGAMSADDQALRKKVAAGGEITVPIGKITLTQPLLVHNDSIMLGRLDRSELHYIGPAGRSAIELADDYPQRIEIGRLKITGTGGGIALGQNRNRECQALNFHDISLDVDGVGIDLVPTVPSGAPPAFCYQSEFARISTISPRNVFIRLQGRMIRIIAPKWQFGTAWSAEALIVLTGLANTGIIESAWNEPRFAATQYKITGGGGGYAARWSIRGQWPEAAGGAPLDLDGAIVWADEIGATPANPIVLRNGAEIQAQKLWASGDDKTVNPATGQPFAAGVALPDTERWRVFAGDGTGKVQAAGVTSATTRPATQPER
jgi:hypothetical protein